MSLVGAVPSREAGWCARRGSRGRFEECGSSVDPDMLWSVVTTASKPAAAAAYD